MKGRLANKVVNNIKLAATRSMVAGIYLLPNSYADTKVHKFNIP